MATSQELYNAYMTRATTGSLDFGSLTLTAGRSAFAGFPALTSIYFDEYQTVDSPYGAYLAPSSFNDLNGNPMTIVFPSDKREICGVMTDDIVGLIEMRGNVRVRDGSGTRSFQDFTAELPKSQSCIHTNPPTNGGNLNGWAELTDLSNLIQPYKIFVWIRRKYLTTFYESWQAITVYFKLVVEMSGGEATTYSSNVAEFSQTFGWVWTHGENIIGTVRSLSHNPVRIDFLNSFFVFKEFPSISFIDKRKFVEADIVTDTPMSYGIPFNTEPVIFKENCFIVPTTTEMTEYSYVNGEIDKRYPRFQINSKMGFYTINISSGTNRNYLGVGKISYDTCSPAYDAKFTAVKYSAHMDTEGELVKDLLLDRKNVHEDLIYEGDSLVWTGDDVNKWYMIDVGYVGSWEVNFTCSGDSRYNNIVSITRSTSRGYDKGNIVFDGKCFYNSSYLTSVDVSNCTEIGESAFVGCTNLVDFYTYGASDSVGREPETYIYVYSKAFSGCTKLEIFSTGSTQISEIHDNAFRGCSNLNSFGRGISSATYIGDAAFYGCSKLDIISNLLNTHASIGPSAFAYSGINHIECFRNNPGEKYYTSIPEKCFFSCTSSDGFANLTYVSSVGASAFGSTPLIRINFNRDITRDSSVGHEPPVIFDKAAFAGITTLKTPPPSSTILPYDTDFYGVSGIIYINCTINNSFDEDMFQNIINDANFPFGANTNVLFIGNPDPEYDETNNCNVYYGVTGTKAISSIRIAL